MIPRARLLVAACLALALPGRAQSQQVDLLIKGGHVIDPKNGISAVMDVAIANGVISQVAANIPTAGAAKVIDARGTYVTPGLIDVHAHVFVGADANRFADGQSSVSPDDFTFRSGVTTVVDPGNAGWRNFPTFKDQVINQSKTRVLAFLNIVGYGLSGDSFNNDLADMAVQQAVAMAKTYPDLIVGVKFGHYKIGDYHVPFGKALAAAEGAGLPLLLECNLPELDVRDALQRMRPGDTFAHAYEVGRRSLLDGHNRVYDYVWAAEKRGILFDVTHGGSSFRFSRAIPAVEQGFLPNTFGTDLHRNSMNAGMKDMLNVMSKFLSMGVSVDDIVLRATWNAAKSVHHEELGNLSPGSVADVAILSQRNGKFGFVDSRGFRMDGDRKFDAEVTIRAGKVVWDLNGLASPLWSPEPTTEVAGK